MAARDGCCCNRGQRYAAAVHDVPGECPGIERADDGYERTRHLGKSLQHPRVCLCAYSNLRHCGLFHSTLLRFTPLYSTFSDGLLRRITTTARRRIYTRSGTRGCLWERWGYGLAVIMSSPPRTSPTVQKATGEPAQPNKKRKNFCCGPSCLTGLNRSPPQVKVDLRGRF